jgi:hypothetical protein
MLAAMNSDKPSEAVPTGEKGSVLKRPGCVTAYALLFFLAACLGLLSPLLYTSSSLGSELSAQELLIRSVRSVAQAVISIMLAVGLWRLRRWAVGLVLLWAIFTFGNGVFSAATTWADRGSAAWYIVLSGLFALLIIYWFIKNRALFKPSPSLDRWIVIGGALVLAVLFVMDIVWV